MIPRSIYLVSALCGSVGTTAIGHVDETTVPDTALAAATEIVDCTLENGDPAQCAKFVVKYLPDNLDIGPFCPATLDDAGGIWDWDGDEPGLYRIDGDFLRMLDAQGYTFFNDAGEVYSFDILVEGPTEPNECIAGSVDPDVEMTLLIPVDPVVADAPTSLGTVAKVGIGLDGVPIFADAPSVLDTGHMPALDICGGHVDPGGWYHWHATATDVNTVFATEGVDAACASVAQDQTAKFGYAFDGVAMFGTLEYDGATPTDLDNCGGHVGITAEGEDPTYHYHASATFPNLPPCLVGVMAQDNFATTARNGIGSTTGGGRPPGQEPNFTEIATRLGVNADLFRNTLQEAGGRNADLNDVAETLGLNVEDLRAAMPAPR